MCELSIYSNIQTGDTRQIEIRDQHTGQPVAHVDARWLNRPDLTLEGRPITVEWVDGEAAWITTSQAESAVYTTAVPLRAKAPVLRSGPAASAPVGTRPGRMLH